MVFRDIGGKMSEDTDKQIIAKKLEEINVSIRKKNKNRFMTWILPIVAIFISFFSLMSVISYQSPNVQHYVPVHDIYIKCIPKLNESWLPYKITFHNVGRDYTRLYLEINGENIEVTDKVSIDDDDKFVVFLNSFYFQSTLQPYELKPEYSITLYIKVHNESKEYADFKVQYKYKTNLFMAFPIKYKKTIKVSNCIYLYDENEKDWVLVNKREPTYNATI